MRPEIAARIAALHYGIDATATRLGGERDLNFHLTGRAGEYVLKCCHPAETRAEADLQTAALAHLADHAPDLPVPAGIATMDGASLAQADGVTIRVLSWLPGMPLYRTASTPALRHSIGQTLARLDLGLQGLFHPAGRRRLIWDLQHFPELEAHLHLVEPPEHRDLAARALDEFRSRVLPVWADLRRQIIHNDFNPHNILVGGATHDQVTGIIDFGDMIEGPLVQDLAVALAYHPDVDDQPLGAIRQVLSAFTSILPLTEAELDVLREMIAARRAMTLITSAWLSARNPDNRDYLTRNVPTALTGLRQLYALPPDRARGLLSAAARENTK
ncbi:phosphotransferase [Paracoccus sp. 11-3]|uniref:Hydroxylysine kinase n=1 Tax=Paracoccus amoyensis TaxID=2760093 RepID=A0A926J5L2_9RHOB|nr:phosphotransferase [Paracoccus amoyensis]MBC9246337.1 phosphotransferase [Paracoccus amoyensis]